MNKAAEIAKTWAKIAETNHLYLAGRGESVFVETPDDQGLTENDPQRALLRVFADVESAKWYKDFMEIAAGPLELWRVELKAFHAKWPLWEKSTRDQMRCPLRAAICVLDEESGWAIPIDELAGPDVVVH